MYKDEIELAVTHDFSELEEELRKHPEWLDPDSIVDNVNKDPRIMMALCQRMTLRVKALLANAYSPSDFLKNIGTQSTDEKFVIATLKALRESLKPLDKPKNSVFGVAFRFVDVKGPDSVKKAAIDQLERELILAQSGYDDPRVLRVPVRFAWAVTKLSPRIGSAVGLHPMITKSLVSILQGEPMRIAFSEEENQHLLEFIVSPSYERDNFTGNSLLYKLQQFALYCSCYPTAFSQHCPETFQNFMTMIKLKKAVHSAIESRPGADEKIIGNKTSGKLACLSADEKAIGEALYASLSKVATLSDCAHCIDDFLNIKTQGVKPTTFLYALIKNLKSLLPSFKEELSADNKGWHDDVRALFRETFYVEYLELTSTYVNQYESYSL